MSEDFDDEDDIDDISDQPASTWAIIIEKRFGIINKLFETFPSGYKKELQKILQEMMNLLSDVAFCTLDNRKQLDSIAQTEFKAMMFNDLAEEAKKNLKPTDNMDVV